LKEKVLLKNPDEFYYGMFSMKRRAPTGKNRTGTVNGDRGNTALSQDATRLYKTQDLGYIRTARNKAAKEVEDLEKRVVGITGHGRKVVFVDDQEEQIERLQADVDMDEDDQNGDEEVDPIAKKLRKMKEKEANKLENKLSIARQRLKALTEAEEALDLQRAKMTKSPTVGGENKHGVKFKVRERKK